MLISNEAKTCYHVTVVDVDGQEAFTSDDDERTNRKILIFDYLPVSAELAEIIEFYTASATNFSIEIRVIKQTTKIEDRHVIESNRNQ